MFNKQQIFTSKLDLWEDGTSKTGFPISFNILSVDLNWETEYWNDEYDTSLTGKKRSNIRGHNLTIQFDYETTLEPDKLETIFDELPNLINRNHRLFLYLDEDDEEAIEIIPTSGTQELLDYNETVGVKSHTLTFESKKILNQVDSLGVPSSHEGGGDADTLEGLTASQFLRSDVDDEFLAGNTLTISGSLVSDGSVRFNNLVRFAGEQVNQLRFQRDGSEFAYSFGIDADGRLDLRNAEEDIQVRFKPSGSALEVLGNVEITKDLEVQGEGSFENDVSIANANFAANNAITGSLGDARYGQLGAGNAWTALNTFQGNHERIRLDGENAFISSFNSSTRQGFIQWNETLDTETILRIASEEGRIELLTGLSGNEQLALSLGSNQDADFQNNIQVSATTVIDSSRNAFFVEGTFFGDVIISGLTTMNDDFDFRGGRIGFGAGATGGRSDFFTSAAQNAIYLTNVNTGSKPFDQIGSLILQTRSDAGGRSIALVTGTDSKARIIVNDSVIEFNEDVTYSDDIQSNSFDVVGGLITGTDVSQAGDIRTASIEANAAIFKSFTAEVSQLFRGETTLSKSFAEIADDFVIPAVSSTATLTIKDVDGFAGHELFAEDDIVEIRPFVTTNDGKVIGSVFGQVTGFTDNGDGTQSWTFETLHTQNGAVAGQTAYAGSEAKSYGSAASPTGVIQDSVFANTPYRQIYTWSTNPWTVGNRTILYQHGDLDEANITDVSGIGVYSANAFFTGSFIVGDLSEEDNFMKFASGELTVNAVNYRLESTNILIDSASEVINIGDDHILDGGDNTVSFSGGVLAATATNVTAAGWQINSTEIRSNSGADNAVVISKDNSSGMLTGGSYNSNGDGLPTIISSHSSSGSFSDRVYVSMGATYVGATWTGRFGFSVIPEKGASALFEVSRDISDGSLTSIMGGWTLEEAKLYGGKIAGEYTGLQSGAGATRTFFAGADDSDGTNAKFFARADGKVKSDAFGEIIIGTLREASTGINTSQVPLPSYEWGVAASCSGTGCSSDTTRRSKRGTTFIKKFSQDTLVVSYVTRNNSSQSGGSTYEFEHHVTLEVLSASGGVSQIDVEEDASSQVGSFEVDISSLTDGTEYTVELGVRATVERTVGGGSGSQGDASTELSNRSIVYVKT